MFSNRIAGLRFKRSLLLPNIVLAHSKSCPTRKARSPCPRSSRKSPSPTAVACGSDTPTKPPSTIKFPVLQRADRSGPVRYGFIPEGWFLFFYPQTGVSGPYVFGLVLVNYWLSKEIYVMEHEYYLGLSVAVVTYYVTTKFGPAIGKSFDAEVDAIEQSWEKERQDEKEMHQATIKAAELAQLRANGQKLLMDAKKENIAMQLEAAYRDRMMHVYRMTKGRLDYHAKKYRAVSKIHQKWMIEWILESVRRAITPEFEKQALDAAIRDLSAVAAK